ncbi:hypothetical protein ABPG75_005448 [Micractinium tetrahymenae]
MAAATLRALPLRAAPGWSSAARQRPQVAARAAQDRGPFAGKFGEWRIEPEDELEVFSYRSALSLVAACFGAGTATALAPEAGWAEALAAHGTALAALGGLSMGAATLLIHVYLDPLKKALQALAAAGLAGGVYLAATHPELPLPAYVAQHAEAVWLVGPSFAALTGIAVKEGFCFGQRESYLLTFLIPALLLGHLSGLLPGDAERVLAVAVALLLAVCAARKFTQPVRDDIGDKSVFDFFKLSDQEQQARLEQLRGEQ